MAIQIPIPTAPIRPYVSLKVTLDGVAFEVRLRWNERAERWFFSLYDAEERTLAPSRAVVLDYPLLARFIRGRRRLPAGQFVAVDTADTGVEPGLEELGTRVQLVYVTAAELPQ